MSRGIERRPAIPLLPVSTLQEVRQSFRSLQERGGQQIIHKPHQLLRPVYENMVTAHVSGEQSHKYRNFAEAIGAVQNGQVRSDMLHSVPNDKFDEDGEKARIERVLGVKLDDPDIISLCKADRQLHEQADVRASQVYELLAGHIDAEHVEVAMSKSLITSAGNDVMVYIEVSKGEFKPLFKPNISLPEDERRHKDALFAYLDDFFLHLPPYFRIEARATTTLLEMRTNLGLLAKDTEHFYGRRPDLHTLETLIYGVTHHTPPRLAKAFIEVAQRAHNPEVWHPDTGLNPKYILGVNGGVDMSHPLWVLACTYDDQGFEVTPTHFDSAAFRGEISQYQRLVLGYPTRLYELTMAMLERIAVEWHGQEIPEESWQELTLVQQHILEKLHADGITPTASWRAVKKPDQPFENRLDREVERLNRIAAIYEALAQEYQETAA